MPSITQKLIALGFAAGCLVHSTGFLLLLVGIELYGPGYPAWRHVVMAAVDAAIACIVVWRPAWLIVVLPTLITEQLLVNGIGLTPAVVLIAWIAVLWERAAISRA